MKLCTKKLKTCDLWVRISKSKLIHSYHQNQSIKFSFQQNEQLSFRDIPDLGLCQQTMHIKESWAIFCNIVTVIILWNDLFPKIVRPIKSNHPNIINEFQALF